MDIDIQRGDDPESAQRDLLAATTVELGDFFVFAVTDMERRDEGEDGAAVRFRMRCELAGRLFDEMIVDVGFSDRPAGSPEILDGLDLLDFADIPRVNVPAVPIAQHVAEKLHAYTKKYGRRGVTSSRVKDLVDLVLIADSTTIPAAELASAIRAVFTSRATHEPPTKVPAPPVEWRTPFRAMARQVGIDPDLDVAFSVAAKFLDAVLQDKVRGGIWNPAIRSWDSTDRPP